jgi:hypothetical protein
MIRVVCSGSQILIVFPSRIPDPRRKKALDLGSGTLDQTIFFTAAATGICSTKKVCDVINLNFKVLIFEKIFPPGRPPIKILKNPYHKNHFCII